MNQLRLYFREHPWQRLAVTLSLTAMLGAFLTLIFREPLSDYVLIRQLTSDKPGVRAQSQARLASRAEASPRTLARLERQLRTDDDDKFVSVARTLNLVGLFTTPSRDVEAHDRWRAIRMATSADPGARYRILWNGCIVDRDNPYMHRLAASGAGDVEVETRAIATVLAAKLGDDATLLALLADDSPLVRGHAAISAAIAGRKDLLERTVEQSDEQDRYAADCMLYALAVVESNLAAPAVCAALRIAPADDDEAQLSLARNLLIADMLPGDSVTEAIRTLIGQYADAGRPLPGLAMLAAARQGITEVRPHVQELLSRLAEQDTELAVTQDQVVAALEAADMLNMPVRKAVYDITTWAWRPEHEDVMVVAARVLGRQADIPQDEADAPTRKGCLRRLIGGVGWFGRQELPGKFDALSYTPLASASAALAVWRMDDEAVRDCLHTAASSSYSLPGDYMAWQISREDPAAGMTIGLTMLPDLDADIDERVYNDNIRAAGAMMLALSARGDEQRAIATERVRSRLLGREYGGEDNQQVRWAFMCALTILGDNTYRDQLSTLLDIAEFPRHRLLTALLVAGETEGLDWLLWHSQFSDGTVARLLVDLHIGDVLAEAAPELPTIEPAAPRAVRLWQARILRDTYAIRHAHLPLQDLP